MDPFTPNKLRINKQIIDLEEICCGVTHPVTGKVITKYKELINNDLFKNTWEDAMCVELGRLAQGYKNIKGTNTVRFMDKNMIKNIPKDRTITYRRIVVN